MAIDDSQPWTLALSSVASLVPGGLARAENDLA